MLILKAIERFLSQKKAFGHYSIETCHTKGYDLRKFASHCAKKNITNTEDLDKQIVNNYIAKMDVKNITKKTKMYTLDVFFKFLVKENLTKENYLKTIEKPRIKYPEADYMTHAEVKHLIHDELVNAPAKAATRNVLIMNLCFTLCLRANEIIQLKEDDISFENNILWITRKGGELVKMPFNNEIEKQLKLWFDVRNTYAGHDSHWVFLSSRGNQFTTRQVRAMITRAMKRAGIKKRKSGPHILRHSGASYRLKRGESIKIIQKLLGHADITSTEKYLHHSEDDLKAIIDNSPEML